VQKQQEDEEVVDRNVLQYCSIDRKQKKTLGEMEQEFLQAMQARARRAPLLLAFISAFLLNLYYLAVN
jgi:hypothetical protein